MTASLLELTRSLHEDIELLQHAVSDEIQQETPKTYKDAVIQNYVVNKSIEQIQENKNKLIELYRDKAE